MREIKFRAWDGEKFGFIEMNVRDLLRVSLPSPSYMPSKFYPQHNEFFDILNIKSIQQATGLKDKNGKEIFEGDIIRSTENNEVLKIGEMLPLSRHLDMLAENIGYYEGKKYHLRSVGGQYHLDDWVSNPEFYEIIGNIYKNSELIK